MHISVEAASEPVKLTHEEFNAMFAKPSIDIEQYRLAVITLIPLAQGDTSGSRAAAQVLLSAYNGGAYQLDITDLCLLDPAYLKAAMTVITGRVELHTEPHTLVPDGDSIFRRLFEDWQRYHATNRWKTDCYTCQGSGKVIIDDDDREETGHDLNTCPRCSGRGLLEQ